MTQVDIYNVYDFVTQDFDERTGKLYLRWDRGNSTLQELMIREDEGLYDNSFINLSYVDYIKSIVNWKEGETVYYKTTSNCILRNRMSIEVLTNPFVDEYTFVELNSDGYLYLREFTGDCMCDKDPIYFTSQKINCFYNECVEQDKNQPYVLK